ncbi:MAG: metallophosphoesterase family protein, partial [Anaerolineae bacterium]
MNHNIVTFVHISDTHFGPTADYARHGFQPYPCAQRVVEIINNLPTKPDFVMHTGDVTTPRDPEAYRLAVEVLGQIEAPVYYAVGNHDTAAFIRQFLHMGPKQELCDDPQRLAYTFDVKGYRFVVLDGRAPDEMDPHGLLPQAQLDWLAAEAERGGPPLTLFLHYPALRMNSTWMDENMLLFNGEQLHQALLPLRHRLRGVFYGHIHQNMQTVRDGIVYTAVSSVFAQFSAWPGHATIQFDPDHLPGFNFIHLLPEQTIMHQHTF